jgi:hypothetical protein
VTDFADKLTLRYLDPANVHALLVPPADASAQRIRALLGNVYQPRLLTVEAVDEVDVREIQFQVPIVEPLFARARFEQLVPTTAQVIGTVEVPALAQTRWLDMTVQTAVTVRVSSSSAPLDSMAADDVSELSEADFIAKFEFLDLAGLLKAARVGSYTELQADFPRLYKLHYADPPAYDPNDPATRRTYGLQVSALFLPTVDLVAALRLLRQSRRAVEALSPHPDGYEGGDLLAARAWLAVFPADAIGPGTPSQGDITGLLGAEGFVAAFETV